MPAAVLVELNFDHGITVARNHFSQLFAATFAGRQVGGPVPIARRYLRCLLTQDQVSALGDADRAGPRAIFRIWPDCRIRPHIDRSASTVKADAATRSYGTSGDGIVWAVVDSGIDATHPHFKRLQSGPHSSPVQGQVMEPPQANLALESMAPPGYNPAKRHTEFLGIRQCRTNYRGELLRSFPATFTLPRATPPPLSFPYGQTTTEVNMESGGAGYVALLLFVTGGSGMPGAKPIWPANAKLMTRLRPRPSHFGMGKDGTISGGEVGRRDPHGR